LLRLIALAVLFALASGWSQAASVVLVSSDGTASYAEVAKVMAFEWRRSGLLEREVENYTLGDLPAEGSISPRLFVALGSRACQALATRDSRIPLLCAVVPRNLLERLVSSDVSKSAGLYGLALDQPAARQLDLIRFAFPKARRLGLMWSRESSSAVSELVSALPARELRAVSPHVEPGELIFSALKKVLAEADVLLALPDPNIYNSSSVQNILLSTFRANLPVVGFSPAYVRAGAVLGLYATPEQTGRQAADLARALLAGRMPVTPVQVPKEFTVDVNEHVMRSLGLALNAAELTQTLLRWESRREK
jgi:ABC-type uncharacterized transport system substrate-binding protein